VIAAAAAAVAGDHHLLHHHLLQLLLPSTLGQGQEKPTWTCAASASAAHRPSYQFYQLNTPVKGSHCVQMISGAPAPAAAAAAATARCGS
jgi:hypothetical protein